MTIVPGRVDETSTCIFSTSTPVTRTLTAPESCASAMLRVSWEDGLDVGTGDEFCVTGGGACWRHELHEARKQSRTRKQKNTGFIAYFFLLREHLPFPKPKVVSAGPETRHKVYCCACARSRPGPSAAPRRTGRLEQMFPCR